MLEVCSRKKTDFGTADRRRLMQRKCVPHLRRPGVHDLGIFDHNGLFQLVQTVGIAIFGFGLRIGMEPDIG